MIKRFFAGFLILLCVSSLSSDELTKSLIEEFNNAGVGLRLDRDEVLKAELKVFDGFIKDPDRAYKCGIRSVTGATMEKNALAFFQLRPDGELRQIYLGHVVLKRRYQQTTAEDQPGWRVLVTAENRLKGFKVCHSAEKQP